MDYREIAVRYDLGPLKVGGDFTLTPTGDLEMTVDGDIKLGDSRHNALHRLVVSWQMEGPLLASMFNAVLGSEEKKRDYKAMIDALVSRRDLDAESIEEFHRLQEAIGVNQMGPGNAAGAIAVALNNMLRREWFDLGKPATWDRAGDKIAGHSFGSVVEAMSNNYRHADEWARHDPPTRQQLESIRVIADVLGTSLPPDGARHPFRGNICPKVILAISGGSFETLADGFFGFGRVLAGL